MTITPDAELLNFLRTRRSAKPAMLMEPGPSDAQLTQILEIAARVPDHKKLAPWRFIVFAGGARGQAGDVFAQACVAEESEPPSETRIIFERQRFERAPVVIAVVSRAQNIPAVPEWEQVLSAGASAYNLCLAANAMGFATAWITEWVAYSPMVREAFGIGADERIAGFVYIGTAQEPQADRDRPLLSEHVTYWRA
ncbi:nitroreductase [Filomicrobium sp.]|uniref:nitroreductase family protein n=1 Tax=Filomicrobium sp. TaxID=2024831 RepID=UPI00258CDFA7|nr:nitroreductase [Filomicrobium sp.]MCV0370784.1 nitroreductase [Filomicrobium sp.]